MLTILNRRDESRKLWLILAVAFAAVFTTASTSRAQSNPDWTEPFPPFSIAGNLYYVGSKGLANYLITTPQGHILINSDLVSSVPLIRASVEKLGFKFGDIRILLISHAHWDHDGGSAAIKKLTGATYMVMDADVSVVESGGKTDFQYGNQPASLYPPTKVDRVLHDGDEVKLGGVTLVARLTPQRPPHPAPYVRDDREAPLLWGRDGGSFRSDLGRRRSEIFFAEGLDSN